MTLVELQRAAHAIEAHYELGMPAPVPHRLVVTFLDEQGTVVAEQAVVSCLAALAVCRVARKAGWHTLTRTGSVL